MYICIYQPDCQKVEHNGINKSLLVNGFLYGKTGGLLSEFLRYYYWLFVILRAMVRAFASFLSPCGYEWSWYKIHNLVIALFGILVRVKAPRIVSNIRLSMKFMAKDRDAPPRQRHYHCCGLAVIMYSAF